MEEKYLPVGFYDSGVGGLSVLSATRALLPNEDYIYFGDNANAPYGSKDEELIKKLSLKCGDFLHSQNVKMIVIACNTATSIVVKTMRENYRIPIISMEPAVKPATEQTSRKVVVMATPATLRQKRYKALLKRLAIEDRVVDLDCGKLAGMVEREAPESDLALYVNEKLKGVESRKPVGAVVLGCTHYSFISGIISKEAKKVFGGECEIFDGMYGTARHVKNVLQQENLLNDAPNKGSVRFFTSDKNTGPDKLRHFYNKFQK